MTILAIHFKMNCSEIQSNNSLTFAELEKCGGTYMRIPKETRYYSSLQRHSPIPCKKKEKNKTRHDKTKVALLVL